jgi:hypothetical protein
MHWVQFRPLELLAGLRWRYSNPPPHGNIYTYIKYNNNNNNKGYRVLKYNVKEESLVYEAILQTEFGSTSDRHGDSIIKGK